VPVINHLESRVASAFYGRFSQLREAQTACIEPLLSGRNVVLTAGTGSGKTEAVVAPLVSKYWREAIRTDSLFLLYIAPTKALVNDLEKRLDLPLSAMNLRVGVRHGDRDDLRSGPVAHVLITTPESLDVMLFRKDAALESLRAVVLDEVHLLYNTQRGLQLSILLNRLRQRLHYPLQWAALSATIGDLSHIRDFLMGPDASADLLAFSAARSIDAQIRYIAAPRQLCSLVKRLTDRQNTKLLIFTNSRRECDVLAGLLQSDQSLRNCVFAHYSSLSPEVRVDTEQKFSAMRTAICVATSTLELGIDIGDIDAVLLWGVPSGVESFLQRIGRGNRRSNKANVICLIPADSKHVPIDALRFAALLDAARKGEMEVREPFELYGAIGQQCISIIASDNGRFTRVADLSELLKHKPYVRRDDVEAILAELAINGFLQRHGCKNQYGAAEELYRLVDLKMIYGNFGVGSQMVDLFHGGRHLGEVPAINLLRVRGRPRVRFTGKCWRVKNISREGIHLEPSRTARDVIDFSYGGSGIPSDPHNANRGWRLVHKDELDFDLFAKDLRQTMKHFRDELRRTCPQDEIPYLRSSEGICYLTFAGYLLNRAVGLYTQRSSFKADNLSLLVTSPIDWASIPSHPLGYEHIFHLLFEPSTKQSIYQKQLPLELQEREYLQNWLKDAEIRHILTRLVGAKTRLVDDQTAADLGFFP